MPYHEPFTQIDWSWREIIRQRLDALGLTQADVCRDLGWNKNVLSRFLKDGTSMSWRRVEMLCDLLGLKLMPGDDNKHTMSTRVVRLEHRIARIDGTAGHGRRRANDSKHTLDDGSLVLTSSGHDDHSERE